MKSSKRVVKAGLVGALVLALGVTTLFSHAGSSYAAGEAKLNKTSRNILTQRSFDFDVTGAPADAVITWKSSDDKTATVDSNGVVTGIKKGNVTITCEVTSAGETQKLTAEVKVRKPAVKIQIKNKITELEYGKTYDLNRTLTPKTSNDVTTWKSSNTKIATVDANGVVKALKDGTVTITATTMSGRSDSVEITVFGAPAPTPVPEITKAPKPTTAPKPTFAPQSSVTKYDVTKLKEAGGYDYKQSGTELSFDKQYAEAKYALTTPLAVKNYESMTIKVGSASDQVAYKLYDANGTMLAVWYGQTATAEFALTESQGQDGSGAAIDQNATVAVIGIMANNGACTVDIKGIEFKAKAGSGTVAEGPKELVYNFADLTPSNLYGVTPDTSAGDCVKLTYDGQYQEIYYQMPKNIKLDDYEKIVIKLATATDTDADAIVVKLAPADAALNEYNNPTPMKEEFGVMSSAPIEKVYAASEFSGKEIGTISFMSNNGAAKATIYSVTFVPKK